MNTLLRFFLPALVILLPAAALGQELPPGPGADVVARTCNQCHGLDQITNAKHTADDWRAVIAQMINNGAVLSDDEQDQVVAYLSKNFGFGTPAPAASAP